MVEYVHHLCEPAAMPDWNYAGIIAVKRTAALAPDAQRSNINLTMVQHL
jgi:hypothetical protein